MSSHVTVVVIEKPSDVCVFPFANKATQRPEADKTFNLSGSTQEQDGIMVKARDTSEHNYEDRVSSATVIVTLHSFPWVKKE